MRFMVTLLIGIYGWIAVLVTAPYLRGRRPLARRRLNLGEVLILVLLLAIDYGVVIVITNDPKERVLRIAVDSVVFLVPILLVTLARLTILKIAMVTTLVADIGLVVLLPLFQ